METNKPTILMSNEPSRKYKIGRERLSAREKQSFEDAKRLLPGGALGGNALAEKSKFVFSHGNGSRFWDTSNNEYIDYVLGSGTFFLGHSHPSVEKAIKDQIGHGAHFFAYLNELALDLAQRLERIIPCAEKMRFTTSGSDATFHAIRLARAFTKREKIVKFEGAYHGGHDYVQMSTTPKNPVNFPNGLPDTSGIPKAVGELALISPYNDPSALEDLLKNYNDEIAAVIIEPIQRIIYPHNNFLQEVRDLCTKYGVLMILDEVVTGFRLGLGGAQEFFSVKPDLATYAKILGGGLPVGLVAGRADIMDQANPSNKGQPDYVYQNGTLQGHMLGCAAGMATLDVLEEDSRLYEKTFSMTEKLKEGLRRIFVDEGLKILVFGEGPMWHMLFTEAEPLNWRELLLADAKKMSFLEAELLHQGIFVLPGNRRFISIKHSEEDLEATFEATKRACKELKKI
jgi:glutamate-1-semialdehyde 2,1-aminomutase